MIEILLICILFFGIFVLFYRQAIEEYNILQIEGSQVADLPKLLSEQSPVVVREIGAPKLFTPETLKGNSRLLTFPVMPSLSLGDYLVMENRPDSVKINYKAAAQLASEAGIQVWAEHTWFPKAFSYQFLQNFHSLTTYAYIGSVGLRKTTAIHTVLYPTSVPLEVTLLTEQQTKFLPKVWRGRFPDQITIHDTPLVGEIKYISVKVRPGNMLWIPTHWYYSVKSQDLSQPCLWASLEIHHPISRLATTMEESIKIDS